MPYNVQSFKQNRCAVLILNTNDTPHTAVCLVDFGFLYDDDAARVAREQFRIEEGKPCLKLYTDDAVEQREARDGRRKEKGKISYASADIAAGKVPVQNAAE